MKRTPGTRPRRTLLLRTAACNTGHVLRRPLYAGLALLAAFLMCGVVLWSLNIQLLLYMLFEAPVSLGTKLQFFTYVYSGLVQNYDNVLALAVLFVSALSGVNTALWVFVVRQRTRSNPGRTTAGWSGGAMTLAVLSSGCVACGTSLLAPVFATVGATSVAAVREIGVVFAYVSCALLLYSIYRLSLLVVKDLGTPSST